MFILHTACLKSNAAIDCACRCPRYKTVRHVIWLKVQPACRQLLLRHHMITQAQHQHTYNTGMWVSTNLFGESRLPASGWTVGTLDEAEGGMHTFCRREWPSGWTCCYRRMMFVCSRHPDCLLLHQAMELLGGGGRAAGGRGSCYGTLHTLLIRQTYVWHHETDSRQRPRICA